MRKAPPRAVTRSCVTRPRRGGPGARKLATVSGACGVPLLDTSARMRRGPPGPGAGVKRSVPLPGCTVANTRYRLAADSARITWAVGGPFTT